MSHKIRQISIDLLEKMYYHGFDSFYEENLEVLYPNYNSKEITKAVQNLSESGKIEVFSLKYIGFDFFLRDFSGHITEKGILEIENYDFFDNNKFSIEIARFLEVVNEADKNVLITNDITDKVILKGSKKKEKELMSLFSTVISQSCKVQKSTSHSGTHCELHIYNSISPITNYGYHILDLYERSTQLFNNKFITNQEMLRKEYYSLQTLIENQLWKDVCVKIGAILEYLLTKWLESKKIAQITHSSQKNPIKLKRAQFWDKIKYYLEKARITFNNEIGDNTSWSIVNNVIREYRNCVHLEKYEERVLTDGYLDKGDYDQLSPAFEQIIQHFS